MKQKAIWVLSRVGTMFTAAATFGFYSSFEAAALALHKRVNNEVTSIIAKAEGKDDVHVLLPGEYVIRYESVEVDEDEEDLSDQDIQYPVTEDLGDVSDYVGEEPPAQ